MSDLAAAGLDSRSIEALVQTRRTLDLEAEYKRVTAAGVRLISRDDPDYPPLLAQTTNPPFLLYVRGTLTELDRWSVAVVGTRQASTYGKEVTRKLVAGLVAAGITVVSGLALGIDAVAHSAALAAGGRTLAVLGSGVDQIYPQTNHNLGTTILQQGALLSEYPVGTLPTATNFPPRNRLIAGLSLGVLVVEAAAKSGALITAQFAAEQGRDVFAVPGNIFSQRSEGTHRLIKDGATLVSGVDDILEVLNLQAAYEQQSIAALLPETPEEIALLRLVEAEPRHIDLIARESTLPQPVVSSTLAMLELKGLVRQVGGMHYALIREADAAYCVDSASFQLDPDEPADLQLDPDDSACFQLDSD
ncbi:MAG TPA: DNA-processing protein DprA, partial [Herpetosiphonaceae bacterium]